jgi:hypothetical protein
MKIVVQIEHSASSSRSKHEGESSFGLCDRLSRTRDNSQRQLPTDQDYAVSTREYQTDQSSLNTAPTAARSVLEKRRNQQQQTHRLRRLTRSLHIRPKRSSSLICAPQRKQVVSDASFGKKRSQCHFRTGNAGADHVSHRRATQIMHQQVGQPGLDPCRRKTKHTEIVA